MKDKQVILIIGHGRSGSTLMSGLLNTPDDSFISGENNLVFYDFFSIFKKMKNTSRRRGAKSVNPWHSNFDIDAVMEGLKDISYKILDANDDYKNIGFKEVRYLDILEDEKTAHLFDKYIDFLMNNLFSGAKVVLLKRNPRDILKSQRKCGWANSLKNPKDVLDFYERVEDAVPEERRFTINYEDLHIGGKEIEKMFSFLNLDYNEDKINATLRTPHSYGLTISKIRNIKKGIDKS